LPAGKLENASISSVKNPEKDYAKNLRRYLFWDELFMRDLRKEGLDSPEKRGSARSAARKIVWDQATI
jgi:hypothetical protein